MPYAIAASNLSKRYVIQHAAETAPMSLRQAIWTRTRNLLRGRGPGRTASYEDFWALKDVGFEIAPGERLGIIGRNGAGKSTLLKILSRITDPTEGRVEIRGRVSSLLEVGTGFHPELTGRENIFLNGTILGMSTREIKRKFDEIVAFAEIERFLDTPVKRYSSGMYVRLAFAVAAHLEPDILVIDEVLSVGDAQFQKKCLGKMKEVTGEGRTVIFVSHNMTTVTSLCSRAVLLEQGRVKAQGPSAEVAAAYFATGGSRHGSEVVYRGSGQEPGDEIARLWSARLVGADGRLLDYVQIEKPIYVEMNFSVQEPGHRLIPNIHLLAQGEYVFVSTPVQQRQLDVGVYKAVACIPAHYLNDGSFTLGVALSSMDPLTVHFFDPEALHFTAIDSLSDPYRNEYTQRMPGVVRPRLEWKVEVVEEEAIG